MNNFCADIHNNISLYLTPSGVKVGHCCLDLKHVLPDNKNYWNTTRLVDIRKLNSDSDQLDKEICARCISTEGTNSGGRRLGVNQYYKDTLGVDHTIPATAGPRGMQIKIDYTCNLACVYCGPADSTQWRLELGTDKKIYPIRLKQPDIIEILDNMDLSNLDNLHFHGGDPLFTNTHQIILEYLDKRVGLDKLFVWYNTNGTMQVNQRVLELWDKCRLIKVYFSLDDVGDRFEYIRYGAKWQEVEQNLYWFRDNCPVNTMFTLQPTLSCLNVLHHHELMDWKRANFDTNRLGDHVDISRHEVYGTLSLDVIPPALLQKCIENNKEDPWFVNFIKGFKFDEHKFGEAKAEIHKLNVRRNLDFAKIFPELAEFYC